MRTLTKATVKKVQPNAQGVSVTCVRLRVRVCCAILLLVHVLFFKTYVYPEGEPYFKKSVNYFFKRDNLELLCAGCAICREC